MPARRSFAVVAAFALAALALSSTEARAATELHASPAGTGTTCTPAAPCSVDTALSRAESGSSIKLATGNYGSVVLRAKKQLANIASNVVVSPVSSSADPTFSGLDSYAAHVTWRGVTVTGAWFLRADAVGSRVEQSHVDGGGLFLRTKDATVSSSLFENGSSIDGIQVGGATNALIENNVIRNYDQSRDNGLHADCIQVFESDDITIRANRISNCYNSGLIISAGGGDGIHGLVIESNFIQGCIVKTDLCRGGSATDLREQTTDGITVRSNTITDGSMRLLPMKNLVFDRNIVEYMAHCESPMTNSIIGKWNAGLCKSPAIVTTNGNQVGTPRYVNKDAGDLRLLDAESARISHVFGTSRPASQSVDGARLSSTIAGAYDPSGPPVSVDAPTAPTGDTPDSTGPTEDTVPPTAHTPGPIPPPAPTARVAASIRKVSVSPAKVVRKRTKAYITLSVSGRGVALDGGKVTVRQNGRKYTGTVRNGRVRIRLGAFTTSGRAKKITASYSGNEVSIGSSVTVKIRVRRS